MGIQWMGAGGWADDIWLEWLTFFKMISIQNLRYLFKISEGNFINI
jgi:hypothetical protein